MVNNGSLLYEPKLERDCLADYSWLPHDQPSGMGCRICRVRRVEVFHWVADTVSGLHGGGAGSVTKRRPQARGGGHNTTSKHCGNSKEKKTLGWTLTQAARSATKGRSTRPTPMRSSERGEYQAIHLNAWPATRPGASHGAHLSGKRLTGGSAALRTICKHFSTCRSRLPCVTKNLK